MAYRRRRSLENLRVAEQPRVGPDFLGPAASKSPLTRQVEEPNCANCGGSESCLGYAQCVLLAPEVLQLQGEEALAYDPNPDDSQRQRVARAVASCPVQAIIVEMDPQQTGATSTHPLVADLVKTFKAEGGS